jgi:hypothetical protein
MLLLGDIWILHCTAGPFQCFPHNEMLLYVCLSLLCMITHGRIYSVSQATVVTSTDPFEKTNYSLSGCGLSYPGLSPEAKVEVWRSVCAPSLFYGVNTIYLSSGNVRKLNKVQGSLIKQSFGLSKFAHCLTLMTLRPWFQMELQTYWDEFYLWNARPEIVSYWRVTYQGLWPIEWPPSGFQWLRLHSVKYSVIRGM